MNFKIININELKEGSIIMVEGEPCTIRSKTRSKPGAHGHAKATVEAVGVFDNKKRILNMPTHEKCEVPEVKKVRGQILSIQENKANIMNLETFETLDIDISEEMASEVKEGDNIEYWEIGERKIIKRTV